MKYFIIAICAIGGIVISAQNRVGFGDNMRQYFCERDTMLDFSFYQGRFSISIINKRGADYVIRDELYSTKYIIVKDSIFAGEYIFIIDAHGGIKSLSTIPYTDMYNERGYMILKNEKLHPLVYYTESGQKVLFGGSWKNGLKHGKWIYADSSGKLSGLVFKDGVVCGSYPIIIEDEDFPANVSPRRP